MKKILLLALMMIGFSVSYAQIKKDNLRTVRVGNSEILWWGYKTVKSEPTTHTGSVKLKMGKFVYNDGIFQSGEFLIDMRSIVNTDQTGEKNAELTEHLKSVDFFDVRKFPMAKFDLKKIVPANNAQYNSTIIGDITIKKKRKTISFPANVVLNGYNVSIESAKFSLDRQDFGVFYKSAIKDFFISDQMDIQFKLYSK